jgi:hypothetical protein
LVGDVDAIQFFSAVGIADTATDKLGALEQALTLWTGPVLEESQGEEWARGETARLTEIHAASVDSYVDQLISAHRATDAIAVVESQIGHYPYRDRSRGLLIRALALAGDSRLNPATNHEAPESRWRYLLSTSTRGSFLKRTDARPNRVMNCKSRSRAASADGVRPCLPVTSQWPRTTGRRMES